MASRDGASKAVEGPFRGGKPRHEMPALTSILSETVRGGGATQGAVSHMVSGWA